jgi:hypothetical protein
MRRYVRMHKWVFVSVILLGLFQLAFSAHASVAAIYGTVEDKFTGEMLGGADNGYPNANVLLDAGSSSSESLTFQNGTFIVIGAPGSGYMLTISAPGYQTLNVRDIELDAMNMINLSVRMEPIDTPDYAILDIGWTRTSAVGAPLEIRLANLNGIPPRESVPNRTGRVPFFSLIVHEQEIPSVSKATYFELDPFGCLSKSTPHRLLLTLPWTAIYDDLRAAGIWDEVIETQTLNYRAEINPVPKIAAENPEFRKSGNNLFEIVLNREDAVDGSEIFEAECVELPDSENGRLTEGLDAGNFPSISLRGSRVIRNNRSEYLKRYGRTRTGIGKAEPIPDAAGWILSDGETSHQLQQMHVDPALDSGFRMLFASRLPPAVAVQETSPESLDLIAWQRQSMALKGTKLQDITSAQVVTVDGKPVSGVTATLTGDLDTRRTLALTAGDAVPGDYYIQFYAGDDEALVVASLWPIRVSIRGVEKP